jgi:hypothetical protein
MLHGHKLPLSQRDIRAIRNESVSTSTTVVAIVDRNSSFTAANRPFVRPSTLLLCMIHRVTRHRMKAPPLRDRISRDYLERLYVREGLTTAVLAERLGTNRESVRRLIHLYGLPMRSKGAGMAAKHGR